MEKRHTKTPWRLSFDERNIITMVFQRRILSQKNMVNKRSDWLKN